jgi:hypothetical protein
MQLGTDELSESFDEEFGAEPADNVTERSEWHVKSRREVRRALRKKKQEEGLELSDWESEVSSEGGDNGLEQLERDFVEAGYREPSCL